MDKFNPTASLLRPLLISKTRAKLLAVFLNNPGKIFYVRELVRAAPRDPVGVPVQGTGLRVGHDLRAQAGRVA